MLHNHLYRHHKPFHLTTLSCIAIVLCGMGASLSIMVLFWCFSSRTSRGGGGSGGQRRRGVLPAGSEQERAKRAMTAVGFLPVVASDDARRTDECCSVCLGEFGKKKKKTMIEGEEESEQEGEDQGSSGEYDEEKGDAEISEWEIRVVPGCGHCFHTRCIQLWLCSYLSCPLCRREIAATSDKPVVDEDLHQVRSASGSAAICEGDQASSSGSLCNGQRNRSPPPSSRPECG